MNALPSQERCRQADKEKKTCQAFNYSLVRLFENAFSNGFAHIQGMTEALYARMTQAAEPALIWSYAAGRGGGGEAPSGLIIVSRRPKNGV